MGWSTLVGGTPYVEGRWGFPSLKSLLVSWILDVWFLGFVVFWFLGFKVSWFLGFKVSGCLAFKVSKIQ